MCRTSARCSSAPEVAKAATAAGAKRLVDIPNVGPSIADDLRALGIQHPLQLRGQDPLVLYLRLCELSRARHDPCLLDTFMAAVAFIDHDDVRPWWAFTAQRKLNWPAVERRLPAALRKP